MSSDDPRDPFANFPGGNPFGAGSPFGGKDPFADMDEFMRRMGIDPDDFQKLFRDMQKNLQDAFKNMGDDPSKGFVSGFSVKMGPDGKPHVNTFGNKPKVNTEGAIPSVGADEREPLTDVIEDAESIAITMEIPGVAKEDVDLNMSTESLEISVDNDARKYHKRVKLPAKVDPSTTKATYTNGVLDVTVQKVDQGDDHVKISIE